MYIARFIVLFEHSMLHMDKYIFPAFFFILLVYYSLIMRNLLIINKKEERDALCVKLLVMSVLCCFGRIKEKLS